MNAQMKMMYMNMYMYMELVYILTYRSLYMWVCSARVIWIVLRPQEREELYTV